MNKEQSSDEEMDDNCTLSPNQHTIIKFTGQQKNLFDNLLAMSKDTHLASSKDVQLFLQKVENCHKNSCAVKAELDIVYVLLEKHIPLFLQSKNFGEQYFAHAKGILVNRERIYARSISS